MAGRGKNKLRITTLDIPIMEHLLSAMQKSENLIQTLKFFDGIQSIRVRVQDHPSRLQGGLTTNVAE